jgi:hypothetical protein
MRFCIVGCRAKRIVAPPLRRDDDGGAEARPSLTRPASQEVSAMSDIQVENYKKFVTKILDRWNSKNEKIGKELAPILEELSKLNATRCKSRPKQQRMKCAWS